MTVASALNDGQSTRKATVKQRFLVISSLFPPDVLGGAEMSASNLALWLLRQGHEVGVLTTAKHPSEAHDAKMENGLKIWRVWMPRLYPQYYFAKAKWWQKPIWHLQDHFDPRNRKIVAKVLREYSPDYINIHTLQGIGYNTLREIGAHNIQTTFFLHDLGLACIRMAMFKNGCTCTRHCMPCKISALYKQNCAKKIPALNFVSPSRANLEILGKYFPVTKWPNAAIMNVNSYPAPTIPREESDVMRILYVGRLHVTKGIDILLKALRVLATKYKFTLTIVGTGPDEARLREEYTSENWCKFTGFVAQQEISNLMINSDVLCIPSIWAENSPGVVIHALSLGLPVIGSNKAGIPELVEDGKNGLLVPAGDNAAWQASLEKVLQNPSMLIPWRQHSLENAYKFNQEYLGQKMLHFLGNVGTQPK